jgi:hypothetical protein
MKDDNKTGLAYLNSLLAVMTKNPFFAALVAGIACKDADPHAHKRQPIRFTGASK